MFSDLYLILYVESVYRFIFLWARFGESAVCMFIEMRKAYMHVMYVSNMTAGKFMDLKFSIQFTHIERIHYSKFGIP